MAEPNKMQEALKKAWAMHEANLDQQRKSVTDDVKEKRKQPDPLQVDFLERKAMKPAFFEWLEIRFDAATKQQVQEQLVPRCDYVKAYIEKNVPIDKCTDHFKGFRDWLIMQIDYLKGQIMDGTVPTLPDDHDEDPSTPASGSSALSVSSPSQSETTSQGSTGTKQPSTASPGKNDPASKLEAFNAVANSLKGKSINQGKRYFETYKTLYNQLASDWDYDMVVQALAEVENDLADKKTPRGPVEKKLLNFRKGILEPLKKEKKPATPADQQNGRKPKDTPPKPTSQQNNRKPKDTPPKPTSQQNTNNKKGNKPNSNGANGQKGKKTG